MDAYTGVVYPLVLVACAVLAVVGLLTLALPRLHRVLKLTAPVAYVAAGAQVVAVLLLLFSGIEADMILAIGYLIASVALLALLGIGRLGTPEAAAGDPDPNRPVLSTEQVARVDAAAAVIVAIALAVVSWRILIILENAA
ncbi:hypothetical protein [Demequina iriomotensis]|uniref:hypothetical protein n=1 Tax=Demequina iriomotensis TaxID=1536641 RepID=UPI000784309B|nr:hypothetical protein [Demequina iriomotensis]